MFLAYFDFPPNVKEFTLLSYSKKSSKSTINSLLQTQKTLTHLTLPDNNTYKKISPDIAISPKLTHLSFYNGDAEFFPPTITHLVFSSLFNTPITKFPPNLKKVTFGEKFNQIVTNLPDTVTRIIFGLSFRCTNIENLPQNLLHLEFLGRAGYVIPAKFPITLKKLIFTHLFYGTFEGQDLPPNLTQFSLPNPDKSTKFTKLPTTLKKLTLGFSPSFTTFYENLPPNIQFLQLDHARFLKNIPDSVTHLVMGHRFCQKIEDYMLPANLTHLELKARYYNEKIIWLPRKLTHFSSEGISLLAVHHYTCDSRTSVIIGALGVKARYY